MRYNWRGFRIFSLLLPHYRKILLGIVLMLGSVGLNLLFPFIIQQIIDQVLLRKQLEQILTYMIAEILPCPNRS